MRGQNKLSNLLTLPTSASMKDFNQLIQQTPETDTPQLFGLPGNIDRSVQRFNSQRVISQLKSLAAVSAEQLRFDKEKWNKMLGPICQLWQTIYKHQDFASIRISPNQLGSTDPIESFVYMEVDYIVRILAEVHEAITYLVKVL